MKYGFGYYQPPFAYYGGAGSTSLVPFHFPVGIAGRPYMVDVVSGDWLRGWEPRLRDSADNSPIPGQAAIGNSGLWPRNQSSWHRGAGQSRLDADGSDPERFAASRRVDPWVEGRLRLLKSCVQHTSSAAASHRLASTGDYVIWSNGAAVVRIHIDTIGSSTALENLGTAITDMATDGKRVWWCAGTTPTVRYLSAPTSAVADWTASGGVTTIGYGLGRVLGARTNGAVYDLTGTPPVTIPAALYTHPGGSNFTWVGFAGGRRHIYGAGHMGNRSTIYRFAINTAGTGLDQPVVAAELPEGEIVQSLYPYLGLVFIGTIAGVRMAAQESDGSLTIGSLIPTNGAVLDFEGEGKFVWATAQALDAATVGLLRMSPEQLTAENTPAYANDLEMATTGSVQAVASLTSTTAVPDDRGVLGRRLFAVSGRGLYYEHATDLETDGYLDSGELSWGLPVYAKLAMRGDILTDISTPATVVEFDMVADGTTVSLGNHTTAEPSSVFDARQTQGRVFSTRITLNSSGNSGPVVRFVQLRAYPMPSRGRLFQVPVALYQKLRDEYLMDRRMDVAAELAFLDSLTSPPRLVLYQAGAQTFSVLVEDVEWRPEALDGDQWHPFQNGIAMVTLKELAA